MIEQKELSIWLYDEQINDTDCNNNDGYFDRTQQCSEVKTHYQSLGYNVRYVEPNNSKYINGAWKTEFVVYLGEI
jgi:hypothetical protein